MFIWSMYCWMSPNLIYITFGFSLMLKVTIQPFRMLSFAQSGLYKSLKMKQVSTRSHQTIY